jgi:hypothetical protein
MEAIDKPNEIYSQTWFGYSTESGFGSIYNNINNKLNK